MEAHIWQGISFVSWHESCGNCGDFYEISIESTMFLLDNLSKMLTGDNSGNKRLLCGMISVCSSAYCPDRAAWETRSVKTAQQDPGGKSQESLVQFCWKD